MDTSEIRSLQSLPQCMRMGECDCLLLLNQLAGERSIMRILMRCSSLPNPLEFHRGYHDNQLYCQADCGTWVAISQSHCLVASSTPLTDVLCALDSLEAETERLARSGQSSLINP